MKRYGISIIMAVLSLALGSQAALIFNYSFNNAGNMTVDDSGNGHTLSVNAGYGTPGYTAAGKFGGAAMFDGSTQGWLSSSGAVYSASAFTFAAWIMPTGTFSLVTTPWSQTSGFTIGYTAGSYRFTTLSGTNLSYIGSVAATNGVWQHIAMTYEVTGGPVSNVYTGTIKGYINGVVVATRTNAVYTSNATGNDMGLGRRSGSVFNGIMDEVYMYNNALTQAEIQTLMIPEPASVSLLGLGILVVLFTRKRRHQAESQKGCL